MLLFTAIITVMSLYTNNDPILTFFASGMSLVFGSFLGAFYSARTVGPIGKESNMQYEGKEGQHCNLHITIVLKKQTRKAIYKRKHKNGIDSFFHR